MIKSFRMKTRDVAFTYRMGAGFAGSVNRTHPATIEPNLPHATTPQTAFGNPGLLDAATGTIRAFAVADASDSTPVAAYGFLVRPYPFQQSSATNYGETGFSSATPPSGPNDQLRAGYIMAKVNGTPAKGGAVYVWCAASSGAHVLGQLEAAATTGSTVKLSNATFNSAPDASGVAEVAVNI